MCSGNTNYFISCHTHPQWGSPYCGEINLFTVKISHFLVSNVPSKFYRLDLDLDLDLDLVFFLNSKDQQKVLRFSLYIVTLAGCDEMKTRREEGGGGASPQSKKEERIPQKNKIMPQKICPNMDRLLENS